MRRRQRFAPAFGHPPGEGRRHFHADQLPQHRTRRLLETVHAARQAQPRRIGRQRAQRLIDAIRRGVQIKQQAHPAQHLRRHQTERRRNLDPNPIARLFRLHAEPAAVFRAALADGDRAQVAAPLDPLHALHGARLQEIQHARPVIGRPIAQVEHQAAGGGPFTARAAAAQRRRDQAVTRLEQLVETPQAAETGGERHLAERQIGVRQQALGLQQPMRLRVIDRRGAKLFGEDAPQMAIGNAQPRRQRFAAVFGQIPLLDELHRHLGIAVAQIDQRQAGRQFRSAFEAGAKPRQFSRRRARIKGAVFQLRRAGAAHRATIDAGGRDADEKTAVEFAVTRAQRVVQRLLLSIHGNARVRFFLHYGTRLAR